MRKAKGFTLVELVIVIVIVGILSIVAVPIYRGYTRKAMATEGKALLGTIQTAQKVYFAEYAEFYGVDGDQTLVELLDVDARPNKYFTSFSISADGDNFTASTSGSSTSGASGISLTLTAGKSVTPEWSDSGLQD